jgi:hypothetical protein
MINIKKHFFPNKTSNVKNTYEKSIYKIYDYDFLSKNESNICEKIKEIPFFLNYYRIIYDYDFIKIGLLNEKYIENVDINSDVDINKTNDYTTYKKKNLLFRYNNIQYIEFNDFLYSLKTPKRFIFYVLDSFSYLLDGLIELNKKNICFFDLSTYNIIFNKENGLKPLLQNFRNSIQISKLNENYVINIIKNTTDFTYKPLEVHILFYLINNEFQTLSYSIIEEICENYVKNLEFLKLFSQSYIDNFKNTCIDSLKNYINIEKSQIICYILEKANTWDIYSLSVLYLHIIGNISRVFSLKDNFLSKFTIYLSKNIHPNHLKRETLENTRKNYDNLLYKYNNWSFINNLSTDKMDLLFELIMN